MIVSEGNYTKARSPYTLSFEKQICTTKLSKFIMSSSNSTFDSAVTSLSFCRVAQTFTNILDISFPVNTFWELFYIFFKKGPKQAEIHLLGPKKTLKTHIQALSPVYVYSCVDDHFGIKGYHRRPRGRLGHPSQHLGVRQRQPLAVCARERHAASEPCSSAL